VILAPVNRADLPAVHAALKAAALGTRQHWADHEIIALPGMDYCALATAPLDPDCARKNKSPRELSVFEKRILKLRA